MTIRSRLTGPFQRKELSNYICNSPHVSSILSSPPHHTCPHQSFIFPLTLFLTPIHLMRTLLESCDHVAHKMNSGKKLKHDLRSYLHFLLWTIKSKDVIHNLLYTFVDNDTYSVLCDIENTTSPSVVRFVGHTFLDGTISLELKIELWSNVN